MTIKEKIDDFIEKINSPQFIVIIVIELIALFLGFYIPFWHSKTYENPQYEKYGMQLRNQFPFTCEIEVCPNEWTWCRNINDEVIKNIECP